MPQTALVLVADVSVIFRSDANGGGVLYHPGSDRAYSVNQLGASIWMLLRKEISSGEIISQMQASLSPDNPPSLREDVEAFLASLVENELAHASE
ncbi:hypothetical protein BMS3Bbin04_00386 [bacterium BMS3Bbin04]|nr:hypothetical protein BMS3Bbin04_00386 [bacterium BMS3Bbin04]